MPLLSYEFQPLVNPARVFFDMLMFRGLPVQINHHLFEGVDGLLALLQKLRVVNWHVQLHTLLEKTFFGVVLSVKNGRLLVTTGQP